LDSPANWPFWCIKRSRLGRSTRRDPGRKKKNSRGKKNARRGHKEKVGGLLYRKNQCALNCIILYVWRQRGKKKMGEKNNNGKKTRKLRKPCMVKGAAPALGDFIGRRKMRVCHEGGGTKSERGETERPWWKKIRTTSQCFGLAGIAPNRQEE